MADDTRKLLRVFGVAVTDFEAEAARLVERAAALDAASTDEARALLRSLAEALREIRSRWLDVTAHLAGLERRLLDRLADGAGPGGGGAGRAGEAGDRGS